MFFISETMKFLIVFALAFATVSCKDLYSRSKVPELENEGRIVNGKSASPGQFPYQAGILSRKQEHLDWCGGSFIGNDWILTSGYCIKGALFVTVYLGGTRRLAPERVYNVTGKKIITHPLYVYGHPWNDIGLLNIPTTYETGTIGMVRLPSNNDDKYFKRTVTMSGWGQTRNGASALSQTLQYGVLEVSAGYHCTNYYHLSFNIDVHICVNTPNKVSGCNGDAGDPLVIHEQNLQIGIYSFGSGVGCEQRHPMVFTRVSHYIDWIESVTESDYSIKKLQHLSK